MIRRPPRSTRKESSAASDVYKRQVCHEAPDNEDQGYPYATGYARSAMSDVADDLSAIVEQLRSEVK